jgi:hypothetical protein
MIGGLSPPCDSLIRIAQRETWWIPVPSDIAALIADLDVVLADIERAASRLDQLRHGVGDDVPLLAVKTIGSTTNTLRSVEAALRTAQGGLA